MQKKDTGSSTPNFRKEAERLSNSEDETKALSWQMAVLSREVRTLQQTVQALTATVEPLAATVEAIGRTTPELETMLQVASATLQTIQREIADHARRMYNEVENHARAATRQLEKLEEQVKNGSGKQRGR